MQYQMERLEMFIKRYPVCFLMFFSLLVSFSKLSLAEEGQATENPRVYKIDDLQRQIVEQHEQFKEYTRTRSEKEKQTLPYIKAWRQKVELDGNLNFPKEAPERHLFGSVTATVLVRANGDIESIQIDLSSRNEELDAAIIQIVKLAAPYASFDERLKSHFDKLSITSSFSFVHNEIVCQ